MISYQILSVLNFGRIRKLSISHKNFLILVRHMHETFDFLFKILTSKTLKNFYILLKGYSLGEKADIF